MQVKLNRLTLQNFKGLTYDLNLGGADASIRGDNATGKSTLYDGFLYLLFGKDSRNQANFQIKTTDEQGNEQNGLEHSVTAGLIIDGQVRTFKKTFREKWQKKKGQAHPTFTGHETKYEIDKSPVKQKEWKDTVFGFIEEDLFRLITDPNYFAGLNWDKKRDLLLKVCGDVSDEEVINSDQELKKLNDYLENRNVEQHKAMVREKKKEINDKLNNIPPRIDELQHTINKAPERDKSAINAQIEDLQQQFEQVRSGSQASVLKKKKADLEADLAQRRNERNNEMETKVSEWKEQKREAQEALADADSQYSEYQRKINRLDKEITEATQEMERLREEYKKKNQEQPEIEEACPTCGQELPQDQVQAAKDNFNTNKAQALKEINEKGKAWKQHREELQQEKQDIEKSIGMLPSKIQGYKANIEHADNEIAKFQNNYTSSVDQKIEDIKAQIGELEHQIENEQAQVDTSQIESALEDERALLSQLDAAENSQARIQELKQEEKELAKQYEDLEQQTHLIEKFTVAKVNMLEEKINSKFDMARFKMFHTQVDGGIADTCEIMYRGVPYNSLNSASRINVGLDIIKTLSQHFEFYAPIFCDHAESVTQIKDPGTQIIKLIVDENYKSLTVEEQSQKQVA